MVKLHGTTCPKIMPEGAGNRKFNFTMMVLNKKDMHFKTH
jgi:hypothetical protein